MNLDVQKNNFHLHPHSPIFMLDIKFKPLNSFNHMTANIELYPDFLVD